MEFLREQFNQVARAIAELARRVRRLETLANFAPTTVAGGEVEEGPGIDIPPGTVRIGVGNDSILLISDSQQPAAEYGFGPTGLSQALSAAGVGDQVRIQGVGTIGGDHAIPDGVEVFGLGRSNTILTGKITAGDCKLNNLSIIRTANDVNDLIALQITSNKSPTVFNCDITATQSGAGNAYGVYVETGNGQPRFEYCHIDGQSAAGEGKGIYQPNSITGDPAGPAILSQYSTGSHRSGLLPGGSATVTFGDEVNEWSVVSVNPRWAWAIWHLDMQGLSSNAGKLEIDVYCSSLSSASTNIKIMDAKDGAHDPSATPSLSGNTSGPTISQGGTVTLNGTTGQTFEDGYFAIETGAGTYNGTFEIQAIRWVPDPTPGGPTIDVWEPATGEEVLTEANTIALWCDIDGSTTDLHAGSGTIRVYACKCDNTSRIGTVEQLEGDRSAFDVANYGLRHASDWNVGDSHHETVTLASDADAILDLTDQEISLDAQPANTVLAGPTSGGDADPDFRSLIADDIPQLTNSHLPDPLAFKTAAALLTISGGAVTATQNVHTIAAETGTTDDLDTISGGVDRQLLLIRADAGDTITVKHSTGNINLNGAADFDLSGEMWLLLFYDGTNWADVGAGGGGGASTFLDLTDTPSSYSGEAGKIANVNDAESAIEFDAPVDISSDDANIEAVNFFEQVSDPATPGASHRALYAKSDGIYEIDDTGAVTGPFGSGTDADAIHDNVASEIHSVTEKASPIGADELLIEDSADSYNKKRVQITNLPTGADADAIHDNVTGEINAVTEKGSPVGADVLLIEDSAASYAKKKVQITNLPGGADADAIHDNVSGEIAAVTEKASPVSGDLILIEDSEATNAKKRVQVGNLPGGGSSSMDYILIKDVKAANTAGGTFTAAAWQTRDLNTEEQDTGGHASISSNQITLAAGTYRCNIIAPANAVNRHKARLQNITDGTTILVGTGAFGGTGVMTNSFITGRFTLAATKVLEVQHQCQSTKTSNGYGVESNLGVDEVYTIVELWKE